MSQIYNLLSILSAISLESGENFSRGWGFMLTFFYFSFKAIWAQFFKSEHPASFMQTLLLAKVAKQFAQGEKIGHIDELSGLLNSIFLVQDSNSAFYYLNLNFVVYNDRSGQFNQHIMNYLILNRQKALSKQIFKHKISISQDNQTKISMNSSSQNQLSSTKARSYSQASSLAYKKELPSTMQEVISMLKKQLRQCKIERQQERQTHKQEISKLSKQIDSLKHKIVNIKEKEYLKTILTEDAEQERMRQASLTNTHKKLKLYVQKLQSDLKLRDEVIEKIKQEKLDIKNERQMLIKEKEKHLQLSIIEKINLEQRIQVLQQQIQSKENLLKALKSQGEQTTSKQIQLKKLQRKLIKKVNQVQQYQQQLKAFKQFQTQKLQTRIQTLQKQNCFLKDHIQKIEHQFNEASECLCSSNQCKKQVEMFRNKYISKSRQLSKVKVELSKEMFKEQFLKDVTSSAGKENLLTEGTVKGKTRGQSSTFKEAASTYKQTQNARTFDYGLVVNKRQHPSKQKYPQNNQLQQDDEILLKKYIQNDSQTSSNNDKTLPNYSLSKYKSQMFKRKDSRPIDMR